MPRNADEGVFMAFPLPQVKFPCINVRMFNQIALRFIARLPDLPPLALLGEHRRRGLAKSGRILCTLLRLLRL